MRKAYRYLIVVVFVTTEVFLMSHQNLHGLRSKKKQ